MREVKIRSNIPVYLVGITWLLYCLFLPMYRWYDFVLAASLSIAVYAVSSRVIPESSIWVEEKRKPVDTGNADADKVIETGKRYLEEMQALNQAIRHPVISEKINELIAVSRKIFQHVEKNPGKERQIRQFMNYYLPTTIKLLKSYEELSRQGMVGDNIRATMLRIEDTMSTIVQAFNRQLDDLFQDKAMDVSVDITVMENMIKQQGLTQVGMGAVEEQTVFTDGTKPAVSAEDKSQNEPDQAQG